MIVGLAAAALAGRVLFDSSDELVTAADTLTSVQAGWVVVAVLLELVSYAARGVAGAVVLRRGGGGVGPVTLMAATMAGDAAAYCLPFGFAASGVVMVGVLRRRQVGAALASWMFAVLSVFYVAAIVVLTVIAVQIPGDDDPVPGLQTISAVLLGVLVLLAAGYAAVRRPAIRRGLARVLPGVRLAVPWRRTPGSDSPGSDSPGSDSPGSDSPGSDSPGSDSPGSDSRGGRLRVALRAAWRDWSSWSKDWARQLRTVRLTPAAGLATFVLMMVSWLADIAVLALAFLALHTTPPWTGLLLAYCAGQIAASLPVTPGGIGVVEGSITVALVAFGGDETITLAAVLLYRLIAYWGCIPVGGLAWLALRATSRAPAAVAIEPPAIDPGPDPVATGVAETEPAS
ncbi:MAG: lysylphosphatidylglycerol synthase transmembrane domain-containing protein [Pseudonocardiaceae bacterium]